MGRPLGQLAGILVLGISLAGAALARDEAPVAVSPGHTDRVALVDSRCPTFSWGGRQGALSYELVVYRTASSGGELQEVVRRRFPGSVASWTPSLDDCMELGIDHAWSVRAERPTGFGPWSEPRLFALRPGPTGSELRDALAVVERYLATREAPREPERTAVRQQQIPPDPTSAAAPQPAAASEGTIEPTLSVDGVVAASSYVTLQPRTGYLRVPGVAFVPNTETRDYTHWLGGFMTGGSHQLISHAPLNLPGGSTITQLTCFVYDWSASSDMTYQALIYRRANQSTAQELLAILDVSTNWAIAGIFQFSTSNISAIPVNNNTHTYWLRVLMDEPDQENLGANIRNYGCRITYTRELL